MKKKLFSPVFIMILIRGLFAFAGLYLATGLLKFLPDPIGQKTLILYLIGLYALVFGVIKLLFYMAPDAPKVLEDKRNIVSILLDHKLEILKVFFNPIVKKEFWKHNRSSFYSIAITFLMVFNNHWYKDHDTFFKALVIVVAIVGLLRTVNKIDEETSLN